MKKMITLYHSVLNSWSLAQKEMRIILEKFWITFGKDLGALISGLYLNGHLHDQNLPVHHAQSTD